MGLFDKYDKGINGGFKFDMPSFNSKLSFQGNNSYGGIGSAIGQAAKGGGSGWADFLTMADPYSKGLGMLGGIAGGLYGIFADKPKLAPYIHAPESISMNEINKAATDNKLWDRSEQLWDINSNINRAQGQALNRQLSGMVPKPRGGSGIGSFLENQRYNAALGNAQDKAGQGMLQNWMQNQNLASQYGTNAYNMGMQWGQMKQDRNISEWQGQNTDNLNRYQAAWNDRNATQDAIKNMFG